MFFIVFLLYLCLSDSKSDDGGDFFDPGDDDDLDEVPDDVSIELSWNSIKLLLLSKKIMT